MSHSCLLFWSKYVHSVIESSVRRIFLGELNLRSLARSYNQEVLCGSTSTSQATEPWDYRFLRKVDVPTSYPNNQPTNQPTNQRTNRRTSTCKKAPVDVPRHVSHLCVTGSLGLVTNTVTVSGIALTLTSFPSRLKTQTWTNWGPLLKRQ